MNLYIHVISALLVVVPSWVVFSHDVNGVLSSEA